MTPGRALVAVAVAAVVGVASAAAAAYAYSAYTHSRDAEARNFELVDRANHLLTLDEALAMSALLAAHTGDRAWVDHYWRDLEALNATLARTEALAAATPNAPNIAQTVAAYDALFEMETRSLEHSARGETGAALAILESAEYGTARAAYIEGVAATLADIRAAAAAEVEEERAFALVATVAALLLLGVLATVIFFLDRARAREQAAHAAQVAENARLETARHARGTVLRAVAHEMENPLTPVSIQLHMLDAGRYGPLTEEQRRSLARLQRSFEQLERLVGDLRDLGGVETGRVKLRVGPVRLDLLAEAVVDRYRAEAATKEVRLVTDLDEVTVAGDPQRLDQVATNLLSNALKYAPPGTEVRVSCRREGGMGRLAITDAGIGLTSDQMTRLFEPFAQVQGPQTQKAGTGLGLYISWAIVEQHGGRAHVHSDGPGRGATFAFDVPTTVAPEPRA